MSKVMFVTVGTSLFHSASWEASESVLRDVPFYDRWTENDSILREPEARKKLPAGDKIQQRLEYVLRTDNTGVWTGRLAADLLRGEPDPVTVMRYSAELATILKLFEIEGKSFPTLGAFLGSYAAIYLPCDSSAQGDANRVYVAAHHLAAYLNRLAEADGMLAQPLAVPGLSSHEPEKLLGARSGLGKLASSLLDAARAGDQLDVIVSGGYKLYGIYLYQRLAAEGLPVRLFYIHEDASRLVKIEITEQGISDIGIM